MGDTIKSTNNMGVTKGNAPIKGLFVKGVKTKTAYKSPEPYEVHMALMIEEFESLPESIKNMVNECPLCYGEGSIDKIVSGKPGLQTYKYPCPNQCYLRNGS